MFWLSLLAALRACLLVATQNVESGRDTWSPWVPWSRCSTSCHHQLAVRSRSCVGNKFRVATNMTSGISSCIGPDTQHRVCERKSNCIASRHVERKAECDKQRHVLFRGRFYSWDPYENPRNRCEVACTSRRYGFYYSFGRPVQDGVPCDEDDETETSRVCLRGRCQVVGCDGIVGSGARSDHCGVCGGNNESCRIIAGIYTRRHLSYGYNQITRIPAGACRVNITELGRSRNYLVLKYTNGSGVINSDRRLMKGSGRYPAAGTVFVYNHARGASCPGQCLYAEGPLTVDMDVQLLFYRQNVGVKYMFTVPASMMDKVLQSYSTTTRGGNSRHHGNRDHQGTRRESAGTRKIGYKQGPQYISPDRPSLQAKGYQPLQSGTNRRYSTQDAINRMREGYTKTPSSQQRPVSRQRERPVSRQRVRVSSNDINTRSDLKLDGRSGNNRDMYRSQYDRTNYGNSGRSDYYRSYGRSTGNQVDTTGYRYPTGAARVGQTGYRTAGDAENQPNVIENQRPKLTIANTIDEVNFHWTISGFTECSQTCGGGGQETIVVCMKRKTNVVVTDANCDPAKKKKKIQTIICNKSPCPPDWEGSAWSLCSATCGEGMQTRRVECKQRYSANMSVPVSASRCNLNVKPSTSQRCEDTPCAHWKAGNWSKCSVECGLGQMTRSVTCVNTKGEVVTHEQCARGKPNKQKSCDMGTCAKGWFMTAWSKQCSTECGAGHHTRTVYCSAEDGSPLPESKCGDRPRVQKSCKKSRPCGGLWFEGPWTQCSATCGEAVQSRDVVCMKKLEGGLFVLVDEENCRQRLKPDSQRTCPDLRACPAEWFMTRWSQCSESCGTGTKTRDLKCLDDKLSPSSDCLGDDKPSLRRTCNTHSCDLPQLDEDPGCKDQWSLCPVAVQARMCKYEYYKLTACCHSCKLHHLKHKKQREKRVRRNSQTQRSS